MLFKNDLILSSLINSTNKAKIKLIINIYKPIFKECINGWTICALTKLSFSSLISWWQQPLCINECVWLWCFLCNIISFFLIAKSIKYPNEMAKTNLVTNKGIIDNILSDEEINIGKASSLQAINTANNVPVVMFLFLYKSSDSSLIKGASKNK